MKTKNFFYILCCVLSISSMLKAQTYISQFKDNGKWGYLNSKGEILIPPTYSKCYEFTSVGLAHVFIAEKKLHAFINTKGELMEPETPCTDLENYSEGLVRAKVGSKWGYLDAKGKLVIPAKYTKATDFNSGYATVAVGDQYYVVDTKGNETPVSVEGIVELKKFADKYAPFKTATGKHGFIGTDGKVAITAQYEGVGYFSGGLAWARTDAKLIGYINTKGEWVIQPKYVQAKEFDPISGMALVKDGETWVYVTKTGEVTNPENDHPDSYSEGLASAKKDGSVGFINAKGEWVIKPQFDATRDFKNGFAAAKLDNKWGFINAKGEWVVKPLYEAVKDMELVK